jgi:hypothetical protein
MKNIKYEMLINYEYRSQRFISIDDYTQVKDLKIWYSTWICDSDRILGATDKGMTTEARIDTREVY